MSKFKVGDKVRVRDDLDTSIHYYMEDVNNGTEIADDMKVFRGEVVTISRIKDLNGFYEISEDKYCRNWTDEMFDRLVEENFVRGDVKNNTTKPPLGVTPRNIFMHERALELSRAIHEYLAAGNKVNQEWLDELWDLNQYIAESEG